VVVLGVVLNGADADLLQIVLAADAAAGFPRLLDGGDQQRHQDPDDGDHHQQLDQGETPPDVLYAHESFT
jgi:hypothetical protein